VEAHVALRSLTLSESVAVAKCRVRHQGGETVVFLRAHGDERFVLTRNLLPRRKYYVSGLVNDDPAAADSRIWKEYGKDLLNSPVFRYTTHVVERGAR